MSATRETPRSHGSRRHQMFGVNSRRTADVDGGAAFVSGGSSPARVHRRSAACSVRRQQSRRELRRVRYAFGNHASGRSERVNKSITINGQRLTIAASPRAI